MFIQQAKSVMPTLWIVAITNGMVQAGQMQVQSKVKKVTQVIKVLKARLDQLDNKEIPVQPEPLVRVVMRKQDGNCRLTRY